jgi:hypothetical protein
MQIEGKRNDLNSKKKQNSFFYCFPSGDEAFRPEVIFNPYIQRMFQVCFFYLFSFFNQLKTKTNFSLLHDVLLHLKNHYHYQIQLWK